MGFDPYVSVIPENSNLSFSKVHRERLPEGDIFDDAMDLICGLLQWHQEERLLAKNALVRYQPALYVASHKLSRSTLSSQHLQLQDRIRQSAFMLVIERNMYKHLMDKQE